MQKQGGAALIEKPQKRSFQALRRSAAYESYSSSVRFFARRLRSRRRTAAPTTITTAAVTTGQRTKPAGSSVRLSRRCGRVGGRDGFRAALLFLRRRADHDQGIHGDAAVIGRDGDAENVFAVSQRLGRVDGHRRLVGRRLGGQAERFNLAPTVSAYAVVRLSNPFSGRPCSQMPASDESVCAAVRRHTRKVYTVILPFLSV